MTDFMKVMQQVQQMQSRLQQIQDELGQKTVSGASGGGMVSVTADGRGQVRAIKIDPSVVDPKDVEMLEDLVTVAVKAALEKAKKLQDEETAKVTGGMGGHGF